ncbi:MULTISPECIES: phytoene desaturase family protein [Kocuria]|uniref:phytoene desaturase family protein n=1 Tax=Kocuria TaxID=57493 RepID=UPI000B1E9DA0|nr:NAD(P)/FAD-dependent oxidoreductase [Kocuria palustris]
MSARHDAIVIGAGLSGLSAAALLARVGLDVVVLEKADGPGGCARSFTRDGFTFDPAVHVTVEARPEAYIGLLLEHLGVADQVVFERFGEIYRVDLPGFSMVAPTGREDFLAAHQDAFPAQARGLAELFEMRRELYEQTSSMPQRLDLAEDIEAVMARVPRVLEHRRSTVESASAPYLDDERARAVMGAIWPYLGSSPDRLSFLLFNQMLETFHTGGWFPRGGFQSLVDAIVCGLESAGGTLRTGAEVTRVLSADGAVTGVELVDGEQILAETVIGASDGTALLAELVGWDALPASWKRRVERYTLAPSAVTLFGGFDGDPQQLGMVDENIVFRHWDHRRTWAELQDGRPGGLWASVPTLVDPGMAPAGRHSVTITGLVPAELSRDWSAAKPELAEDMIAAVETAFPGFRDGFDLMETATPATYARWTGNRGGAAYGWENTPSQTASKRLPHVTPLKGLLLAGHWSEEGESSLRALTSGRAVAELAAERHGLAGAVPSFGGPSSLREAARAGS